MDCTYSDGRNGVAPDGRDDGSCVFASPFEADVFCIDGGILYQFSYSALPLIISDAKEKFGVSNNIASFTVPLGITFNKVGTIIYECVAVIFVAQAVGMEFTATQQVSLIGVSIVTVLGALGVPMAGEMLLPFS